MDASKLANATSAAGPTLLEILWEELDRTTDRLMKTGYSKKEPSRPETQGYARGLAFAIATIENPYETDIADVKERAMERWEERE